MNEKEKKEVVRFGGSPNFAETASNRGVLPESVYSNLPEPLKQITNLFEDRERDIILLSSIGVISSCLPNVSGVYGKRKLNTNLYIFIVAPPASGKGVMNWAIKLIEPIHDAMILQSRIKMREYSNSQDNDGVQKPKLQIKILPGNTSSSKVYSHLEDAKEDLIIFESEADSLTNMLKQDWGDFSDLLRKAFHHEKVSISRQSEDRFYEIKRPQLSLVLSGTPNQVKPLIDSKENGLFSRFAYYYFNEVQGWKDVSPSANENSYDELFEEKAQEIKTLYEKLKSIEKVEIKMTENQWAVFQGRMSLANEIIINTNKIDFDPIVKRLGLIAFRIILILTVLQKSEEIIQENNVLVVDDNILNVTIEIVKMLFDHSLNVFDMMDRKAISMTMQERNLYSKLGQNFKRSDGLIVAQRLNIPVRTFDEILKKWNNQKVLQKVTHGTYEKVKK